MAEDLDFAAGLGALADLEAAEDLAFLRAAGAEAPVFSVLAIPSFQAKPSGARLK